MAACREYLPHTDPFGSVQHCPTGSTQPSLPDHLAGHRHNSGLGSVSRPSLTAPLQGWLVRANPRSGIAASLRALRSFSQPHSLVFDFGPPPRFTALCAQ